MSARVFLVASSDDYLLEEALAERLASLCTELEDIKPETLPDDVTPEDLSVELCSPSLFSPQRILVLPEVRSWLDIPAKRPPASRPAVPAAVDPTPVVQVLGEGVADGITLVMGACCHSKPKGQLVDAVADTGDFRWEPVPEPPKPWEDAVLSKEQEVVLRNLLSKAVGDTRVDPDASQLLLERLGFSPRLLVQEGRKLAAAADGLIDEELVLALSFPKERSLDVVWDAVLSRRSAPVLDILAAAEDGVPVRDRQGRVVSSNGLTQILFSQLSTLLQNLLYLRRLAAENGLGGDMAPDKTQGDGWYPRRFKSDLGPRLRELAENDAPSPIVGAAGKVPSLFVLGRLFRGAGRYEDEELVNALAEVGDVETALRGEMAREALSAWVVSFLH